MPKPSAREQPRCANEDANHLRKRSWLLDPRLSVPLLGHGRCPARWLPVPPAGAWAALALAEALARTGCGLIKTNRTAPGGETPAEAPDCHKPLLDAAGKLRQVPEGSCLLSGQVRVTTWPGVPSPAPASPDTCVSTALHGVRPPPTTEVPVYTANLAGT